MDVRIGSGRGPGAWDERAQQAFLRDLDQLDCGDEAARGRFRERYCPTCRRTRSEGQPPERRLAECEVALCGMWDAETLVAMQGFARVVLEMWATPRPLASDDPEVAAMLGFINNSGSGMVGLGRTPDGWLTRVTLARTLREMGLTALVGALLSNWGEVTLTGERISGATADDLVRARTAAITRLRKIEAAGMRDSGLSDNAIAQFLGLKDRRVLRDWLGARSEWEKVREQKWAELRLGETGEIPI